MYDVPEQLIVEADGPIRIITMNNPDMRNAFIDPLHEAMRNIWYQISRDRDARAVVLTGAGSAFCARRATFLASSATTTTPSTGASRSATRSGWSTRCCASTSPWSPRSTVPPSAWVRASP